MRAPAKLIEPLIFELLKVTLPELLINSDRSINVPEDDP